MSALLEHKCPACGGTMVFRPQDGLLQCEYCDTKMSVEDYAKTQAENTHQMEQEETAAQEAAAGQTDIQQDVQAPAPTDMQQGVQANTQTAPSPAPSEKPEQDDPNSQLSGFDFDSLTDQASDETAANLPVYYCVSCAAEVIAPAEQVALSCPYCGNNIVLTDKVSGPLRPDAIIPFSITSDQVAAAVKRYYKGKVLLPKGFFGASSIGNITGVYLPFWVFDGKVGGTVTYTGNKTSHYSEGNYNVTEVKHYYLSRKVSMQFQSIPIDASKKADDAIMDTVGPFDISKAKPFDMAYMAGFTADRFDVKKSAMKQKANTRIINSASRIAMARGTAGYSGVRHSKGNLNAELSARYMLFPLYLFELQHEGKKYPFAMNGQTGKVAGKLPIDKAVSRAYFWTRVGVTGGVLILFSVIKYLLGF
ncbi:MAG: hypothetical protein K6E18_05605 [Lachnospiraceae bacterium]|nr:hypothetical protein [Lachnospiraceae bacterium]